MEPALCEIIAAPSIDQHAIQQTVLWTEQLTENQLYM